MISLKESHPPRPTKCAMNYEVRDGKILLEKNYDLIELNFGDKKFFKLEFVIDLQGRLHVGYEHFFLSNEASHVLGAGDIILDGENRVVVVTSISGHYKPTEQEADNLKELIERAGVDLSSAMVYKKTKS